MDHKFLTFLCILIVGVLALGLTSAEAKKKYGGYGGCRGKRSTEVHKSPNSMFHHHMSRKVFDRACASSKDVIDEIVECIQSNPIISKQMSGGESKDCHKQAFGIDFDPKDMAKHKDLMCKQRDKFEDMISCSFHKISDSSSAKEMEALTEAMVDVGLCVVNALDG